jgi:hypothetical protein
MMVAWNILKGIAAIAAVLFFAEVGRTYVSAELTYARVINDCAVEHKTFEKCRFDTRGAF